MNNKRPSIKNGTINIRKILKNPQYRGIIVLALYFVFFLIIIIGLRTTNSNSSSSNQQKNDSNFEYDLTIINSNNYYFSYEVDLNNNKIVYDGKKYADKEMFTKTSDSGVESFYNYNDNYFKNINNVWSKTENPYLFPDFRTYTVIEKLLTTATYESKTEFNNKSKIYNYQISTTSINKIVDKINIDIADNPNTILITTNEQNQVIRIEMNLNSYISYKNQSNNQLKLILNYSKFGEVEEIEDPN